MNTSPLSVHVAGAGLPPPAGTEFESIERDGDPWLVIRNVDRMDPFFMSVVSDSDHWLFAGSNGPFTAGRIDPDHALFPYQTVDKILRRPDTCGALTVFLVGRDDGWARWEPWRRESDLYRRERTLSKNAWGTRLVFEEINRDLGLRFESELTCSAPFGIVRRCRLVNEGDHPVSVRMLDGWHHLTAPGVDPALYGLTSYLAEAYMHHEQDAETGLGIFALNARISDRTDPAECLRANCAWAVGHTDPVILLCDRQVDAFRRGEPVRAEPSIRGRFGAYLAATEVVIEPGATHRWDCVADAHLDTAGVVDLRARLEDPAGLQRALDESVSANTARLRKRIAAADGLQDSADPAACYHHFANTLFNCMRGGTFDNDYQVPPGDFARFVRTRNRACHQRNQAWLDALPEEDTLSRLADRAAETGDPDLQRLAREYLPLTFSRRHGDPSRPWNRFSIRIRDDSGTPVYTYQGNWRDIFQNWESLALSYPAALPSMIAVFLNASTADGYNPYRITREGIDWEIDDPDDPWSHIGYWGDHQIVYLLRLLEAAERYAPGSLAAGLDRRQYASANVPYRIAGFDTILADPRHTIRFDHDLHEKLHADADAEGGDAKCVRDPDGGILLVTLAEKLLVPALVKLTNLVPGGGIWLNTQRPEWNDANNALAGWGLSMVTVCYLRRYLRFLRDLVAASEASGLEVSARVADLVAGVTAALESIDTGDGALSDDRARFTGMEALGRAGESHRDAVYAGDGTAPRTLGRDAIDRCIAEAQRVLDATIRASRREDGLYHSYNVLGHPAPGGTATVSRLDPMLEGQVAVASSGALDPDGLVDLFRALRASALFRDDQHSYLLYPDRTIPPYLSRNRLPDDARTRAPLLADLVDSGDRSLVVEDRLGHLHFHADFQHAGDVRTRLDVLADDPGWAERVERDREPILVLWEEVFQHRFFTGRSGTMFGFEGLGSIYWHMVAKLLVSAQEGHAAAKGTTREALASAYHDIRDGLGFRKDPNTYGAFPTDPYSHTPAHRGAQQPGMTGQVKEELITRFGELGVVIENGRIAFRPELLPRGEFQREPGRFAYVDLDGTEAAWDLPADALAFTLCQVPVCYRLAEDPGATLTLADGTTVALDEPVLSPDHSRAIFLREGSVRKIEVAVPRDRLWTSTEP